jgi:drug/metabolite transporter (DMT)-like permease
MDNLRGILLMVASMAGFAMEDMFIKWAAADLPTGQILLVIGLAGAPVFAAMAALRGTSVLSRGFFAAPILGRNFGEMVGTFGFVTALALVPLSMVSAILQAMPLAVTCGAALFLGEQVGWRRWSAIVAGFVGVLIVIRPGAEGFRPEALWAVLAVLGLSLRDLATRRVPARISSLQVSSWAFLAVGLLGELMMLAEPRGFVAMTLRQGLLLGGAVAFGIVAYWTITAAMRMGEISVITPFRYSRLVFGLAIGILVFGERLDAPMLAGAGLIVASGLYTFARERRLRKRALSIEAP